MNSFEKALTYLPAEAALLLGNHEKRNVFTDIRLRVNRRPLAVYPGGDVEAGGVLSAADLSRVAGVMLEHSLYCWEDELGEGFFTLPGGSRVGVCGRFSGAGEKIRLTGISSLCIRISREVPGCSQHIKEKVFPKGRALNAVILGPPGSGKTTLLRDLCKTASLLGMQVGIADERGEIASMRDCAPGMDIGARVDVIDGILKADAIKRLVRSMGPDFIVTDELGAEGDVAAVREAARMGVGILATVHAASLADAVKRPMTAHIMNEGIFERAIVLEKPFGKINSIHEWTFGRGWDGL